MRYQEFTNQYHIALFIALSNNFGQLRHNKYMTRKPGTTATIVKKDAMATARSHFPSSSVSSSLSNDFTKRLLLNDVTLLINDELNVFNNPTVGTVIVVFCGDDVVAESSCFSDISNVNWMAFKAGRAETLVIVEGKYSTTIKIMKIL